jgi:hypothetical protein
MQSKQPFEINPDLITPHMWAKILSTYIKENDLLKRQVTPFLTNQHALTKEKPIIIHTFILNKHLYLVEEINSRR